MHQGPRRLRSILAIAAGATLVIGCSAAPEPSPTGTASTPTATAAAPSATPAPPTDAPSPGATQPGQSDTDWERIWDDVPAGFPAYPGAHPTETGEGPASAILDAGAADPAAVVNWYQTTLAAANYKAVSNDGPREDGSFELITNGGACDIRITATPLGGSTIITVMYGAGCPFV